MATCTTIEYLLLIDHMIIVTVVFLDSDWMYFHLVNENKVTSRTLSTTHGQQIRSHFNATFTGRIIDEVGVYNVLHDVLLNFEKNISLTCFSTHSVTLWQGYE